MTSIDIVTLTLTLTLILLFLSNIRHDIVHRFEVKAALIKYDVDKSGQLELGEFVYMYGDGWRDYFHFREGPEHESVMRYLAELGLELTKMASERVAAACRIQCIFRGKDRKCTRLNSSH